MLTRLSRHASDALVRLNPPQRAHVIARAVSRLADSIAAQRRRRGLPLSCPFTCCHWEADRPRISPSQRALLRDHLIASHATALLLMED